MMKQLVKVTFTTKTKEIFNISDIDINKILASKKETYGYNDNGAIRPLYLFLPRIKKNKEKRIK